MHFLHMIAHIIKGFESFLYSIQLSTVQLCSVQLCSVQFSSLTDREREREKEILILQLLKHY